MKQSFRAGFTLIELLVVIAIIGILSTIGLTAFTNAQRGSRDAKRQGDMTDVQKSFEQYAAQNNGYLANCGVAMYAQLPTAAAPVDPKNVVPYTYTCTSSTTAYCDCAALENLGQGNATTTCGAAGAPPTWGKPVAGVQGYFCVRSLQ